MKDKPSQAPRYGCVASSIQQHANLLLQLMMLSSQSTEGGRDGGGPEPTGHSRPLTADEAIRERQRRTRERWAAEAAQRPQTVRHEHYVHVPRASEAKTAQRDVIDAEIVEDTQSNTTFVPAVKAGSMRALPRSTGSADDVLTSWIEGQRHGR